MSLFVWQDAQGHVKKGDVIGVEFV